MPTNLRRGANGSANGSAITPAVVSVPTVAAHSVQPTSPAAAATSVSHEHTEDQPMSVDSFASGHAACPLPACITAALAPNFVPPPRLTIPDNYLMSTMAARNDVGRHARPAVPVPITTIMSQYYDIRAMAASYVANHDEVAVAGQNSYERTSRHAWHPHQLKAQHRVDRIVYEKTLVTSIMNQLRPLADQLEHDDWQYF